MQKSHSIYTPRTEKLSVGCIHSGYLYTYMALGIGSVFGGRCVMTTNDQDWIRIWMGRDSGMVTFYGQGRRNRVGVIKLAIDFC